MRKIVYYIASSLDGYIAGPDDDVSSFAYKGQAIKKYLEDLKAFNTVIMGRSTYEFGYKFGVQPGQPSPVYSHMKHYIFSNNLSFDNPNKQVEVKNVDMKEIESIRKNSDTDIYLCGGGKFAGWMLDKQQIDILKLKLNPLILGAGTRLFGESSRKYSLQLIDTEGYDCGIQIVTYRINYEK